MKSIKQIVDDENFKTENNFEQLIFKKHWEKIRNFGI